jgi:hypothetical protein
MNFGRLLAAGRSIINGGGSVAYRENRHVYVPKFEPAKNPFARTTPAPAAPVTTGPGPVATPVKLATTASYKAAAPAWTTRLNPMTHFRAAAEESVRPVNAVQTELSLDTVRVLHNDLSDAEVEVVPIKSRPAPAVEPRVAVPVAGWSELGAKIFRVNAV